MKKYLYDKGQRLCAKWDETGETLYVRGLINAMLGVEAIRTAQEKFGKTPLTGKQVRWGLENLNLTAERLNQLGFENELQAIKVSCADHEGTPSGRSFSGRRWKKRAANRSGRVLPKSTAALVSYRATFSSARSRTRLRSSSTI